MTKIPRWLTPPSYSVPSACSTWQDWAVTHGLSYCHLSSAVHMMRSTAESRPTGTGHHTSYGNICDHPWWQSRCTARDLQHSGQGRELTTVRIFWMWTETTLPYLGKLLATMSLVMEKFTNGLKHSPILMWNWLRDQILKLNRICWNSECCNITFGTSRAISTSSCTAINTFTSMRCGLAWKQSTWCKLDTDTDTKRWKNGQSCFNTAQWERSWTGYVTDKGT